MRNSDERRDSNKPSDHVVLRRRIEDAVNDSLDPLAAHKALKSLHPLFQDLSQFKKEDWSTQKASSNCDIRQRQFSKQIHKSNHGEMEQKPICLPSIQAILTHNRVNLSRIPDSQHSIGDNALKAVTTACDAAKVSDDRTKQELFRGRKGSEANSSTYGESSYDSSAAVMLLRLERLSRRPDFSSFWGWKSSSHGKSDPKIRISKIVDLSAKDDINTTIDIDCGIGSTAKGSRDSKVERVRRMQQIYRTHALESVTEVIPNPDSFPPQLAPPLNSAHLDVAVRDHSTADRDVTLHDKTATLQRIVTSVDCAVDAKGVTDFDMSRISKYFMTVDAKYSSDESNLLREFTASRRCADISAIIKTKGSTDGSVDALQRPTSTRTSTRTNTSKDKGVRARIKAGIGIGMGIGDLIKLDNKAVTVDEAFVAADLSGHDSNQINLFNNGVKGWYSKPAIARSHSLHEDIIEDNRLIGIHHESQKSLGNSQPLCLYENLRIKRSVEAKMFFTKDTDLSLKLINGHEKSHENGHENRHEDGDEYGHENGHETAHEHRSYENSDEEKESDWDWEENALNTSRSDSPHRDWNGNRGQVQGLLDWTMDLDPDTV